MVKGVNQTFLDARKQHSEQKECSIVCTVCEGYNHHWLEDFDDNDEPVWSCKHCSIEIAYGEKETHILSCDCPDCEV